MSQLARDAFTLSGRREIRARGESFTSRRESLSPATTDSERNREPDSVRERLGRRAGAEQVAVAVRVVDAAHRRPVLIADEAPQRIGRLLAAVRVAPLPLDDGLRCVRGMTKRFLSVMGERTKPG